MSAPVEYATTDTHSFTITVDEVVGQSVEATVLLDGRELHYEAASMLEVFAAIARDPALAFTAGES
jgi:hypothetical protein